MSRATLQEFNETDCFTDLLKHSPVDQRKPTVAALENREVVFHLFVVLGRLPPELESPFLRIVVLDPTRALQAPTMQVRYQEVLFRRIRRVRDELMEFHELQPERQY